ncbi:heparin lyase I family protein [Methylobacterium haplocladii]|uniref:Uncharacterized protein n=1 Tax=Methylobacterium haplocladii TaxID=1176176 RepID=A0A512IW43_9HYPH|nr:heparin lyase I family protein [Methylobacterium haplocladii]GEP01928.1 hypothetical protein MHA02_43150 [Methylobacterium haplocladii]GJD86189.1 hypothetical protein HPGCJGGD_4086 [Methylobacterium haplocladii]GLS61357.1 hypothetical protein GCM10007887_40640 [Methylobacterium haplocladii]
MAGWFVIALGLAAALPLMPAQAAEGRATGSGAFLEQGDRPAQTLADAIAARDAALARLRARLDTVQTDGNGDAALAQAQSDLSAAEAQVTELMAQFVPGSSPASDDRPRPDARPAPAAGVSYRELRIGEKVKFAGEHWAAQTRRIQHGSDGSLQFHAAAGERADFDPERKIRTELIGLSRFEKGQAVDLKGVFSIDPSTRLTGADWCSIIQIHQADTKRADGNYVNASPMFALDMLPDPKTGRPFLQVVGETGRGEQTTFSPTRVLGTLPDVELGKEHTFAMRVVDGHGDIGQVSVWVDGVALVDRSDIPTGYEYVDIFKNAFPVRGAPQQTGSYLKLGIYSGKVSGNTPPAVSVGLTWRSLPDP